MDDEKLFQKIEAYEKAAETDSDAALNALRQYILQNGVTHKEVSEVFIKYQQMPLRQAHLQALRLMKVMIPQETIEQVAAASDIVQVIGSYFPLKPIGTEFRALCPFHQEETPSFCV